MDSGRKARLGVRYICFSCGCRFYDLNRPEPVCPKCGSDQRQIPEDEEKPKPKRVRKAKKKIAINPALVAEDDAATRNEDDLDSLDLESEGDFEIDIDEG